MFRIRHPRHRTVTLHLEPSHIGHIAQSVSVCTAIPSSHASLGPENKVAIRNAGGIDPLVQLLKAGGDAKAASAAAGALQNIAAHNAAHNTQGGAWGRGGHPTAIQPPSSRHRTAIQPPLAPHPYLVERLKQVATKRMRRREGGVDAPTLVKARPSPLPSWCRWDPRL